MSEPADPPVTQGQGRGLRIALALSVAVNLAVAGMVVGIFLHGRPHGRDEMVRSVGFGPFNDALRPADQRDLRAAFLKETPDFRAERAQVRADNAAVLAALRATPYDPAALDAAMTSMQLHATQRMVLGRGLMQNFLNALSPADRLAFADRLEASLHHGPRPGNGTPRPSDPAPAPSPDK